MHIDICARMHARVYLHALNLLLQFTFYFLVIWLKIITTVDSKYATSI